MSRRSRNTPIDPDVQSLLDVFEDYEKAHPSADVEVYRQNWSSLRIRVIDPDFKGMDMVERDDAIWKILEQAPEDVQSQITFLLLLRPQEMKKSFANMEFDDPVSSHL
jgi:stress-induced morphogen